VVGSVILSFHSLKYKAFFHKALSKHFQVLYFIAPLFISICAYFISRVTLWELAVKYI
jgi:hypothetical protein